MRIAYVCADPGVPVFGTKGASIHVQSVVRELDRRGHDVTLLARRRGGDPSAELSHVARHRLPATPTGVPGDRERALLASNAEVGRILAATGPHDLVYERYSLWSTAGIDHARRAGIPSVLEVNAPLVEEQERHRRLVHRDGALAVAAHVVGGATATIAVSEPVAAWARARTPDPGRVHIVPNGVDLHRITPPTTPNDHRRDHDPARTFTVGFLGSLKPWHGLDVLVDAMARLRGPGHLVLIGDGPQRADIEARAHRLGIGDRVHLVGAVAPDQVGARLQGLDVAVAPYPAGVDHYFSPLKVFEYLAAGRPVVASAVGQIPSLLTHDREALLVAPGDPDALAVALAALRDDPARRRRLGRAARRTAEDRHGWDRVVDRTLDAVGCPRGADPLAPDPLAPDPLAPEVGADPLGAAP